MQKLPSLQIVHHIANTYHQNNHKTINWHVGIFSDELRKRMKLHQKDSEIINKIKMTQNRRCHQNKSNDFVDYIKLSAVSQ